MESILSLEFKKIDEEIEYLKQAIKPEDINITKNAKKCQIIEITLRKCLLLRFVVPESYPLKLDCSDADNFLSAKLHTFDTKNLKPTRKQTIEKFITGINLDLNDIICSSFNSCCVVNAFKKVQTIILENTYDFLDESFTVLESQVKNQFFSNNQEENLVNTEIKSKLIESSKNDDNSDNCTSNKQKLKGADLIFKRIKWDSSIDKDQIIISYLDRFLGIKEIKFSEFKGVHEDRDGIPLHRIRNFKINDTIVWDRDQRIDLLTGKEINKYFKIPSKTFDNQVVEPEAIKISQTESQVTESPIFHFYKNNWKEADNSQIKPNFIGGFKFLTYNIMSKNNFKKSIIDVINGQDKDFGLKDLHLVDRMEKIISLIDKSDPDFVFLQECENYEEEKLQECEQIRKNYYFCSSTRSKNQNHSNCVILSKVKPKYFKVIQLSENSNKQALIVKIELKRNSLKKVEELILINVHLTSDKSNNCQIKRKSQLETLHKYFVSESEESVNLRDLHQLNSDYTLIGGDFNFGDELDFETGLLQKLFLDKGFIDTCPNALTFDPTSNFTASITSSKNYARRLDRVLFRSLKKEKCEFENAFLVNTAPFTVTACNRPTYEPYLNISCYTTLNKLPILNENNIESESNYVNLIDCFLNPSDHYGLECSFKLKNALSSSNLQRKSSLAIIATNSSNELIQKIRKAYDSQFERWPPHFNLLYPFYESIEIDCTEDEENSIIGDILSCLSNFEPFECELKEIGTFEKNHVVFLKPDMNTATKIGSVYKALKKLFEDSKSSSWRDEFTPHMTIAQPEDKKTISKSSNWAKTTSEKIQKEFDHLKKFGSYASFVIDCVYWIKRTDSTPFEVKQIFPLGKVYPQTIVNLIPCEVTDGNNILKFLNDKNMLSSIKNYESVNLLQQKVLGQIFNSLKNTAKNLNTQDEQKFSAEIKNFGTVLVTGSFLHGIKSNDLDYIVIENSPTFEDGLFASRLVYDLAQNSDLFHIVRNVADATVPIIELCLKTNDNNSDKEIECADIQIYDESSLVETILHHTSTDLFYQNYEFMKELNNKLADKQKKLFAISGIFENQNIKKYINYYKDYQILISFIKYWAKCRCIYGKAYGYLGGISWSIMAIYFLRKKSLNSYGHILQIDNNAQRFSRIVHDFFEFYSEWNWLDPISLISLDFVHKVARKHIEKSSLMILQSVFPYQNTSKNVSIQYKNIIVDEIKRASKILSSNSMDFYRIYENVCAEFELNEIKGRNHLAFKIEYNHNQDLNHLITLVKAKSQKLVTNIQRVCTDTNVVRVYPNFFMEEKQINSNKSFKNHAYFLIEFIGNEVFDAIKQGKIDNFCADFIQDIKSLSHVCDYSISLETKISPNF